VRRLVPARDDAQAVYVQSAGARVGKQGETLRIEPRDGPVVEARLMETSQLAVFGHVQVSTQAVHELCRRGIPVCWFSGGGWFLGMTSGMPSKNVELRRCQYRVAEDAAHATALARRLVAAKIRNARTLLRRNHGAPPTAVLRDLEQLAVAAEGAEEPATLLGLEGAAASAYFGEFSALLRPRAEGDVPAFDFTTRNRRPPRDPINALLSLAYALLAKDLTVTALAVGLDPFLGFYHRPRYGRPALALDLMEEFRPLVADSTVLQVVNTGVVGRDDFVRTAGAVALKPHARAAFIQAYERRMDQLVTHPVFDYRISYRRVLEVQVRLLARHLVGEIAEFPPFLTR
jgi:CRISPR-associated protein Cas1